MIDLRSEDHQKRPTIYWVNLDAFDDYYIARVHFFPDNTLALQIENRPQTRLQLYQYDIRTPQQLKLLLEETSQSWINLHDLFHTLKRTPKQFIWASERSGFMHLELRDVDSGRLIRALTAGNWVVQEIVDVDEKNSLVYFLANRETPLEVHLYSVNYSDPTPTVDRITQEAGCHVAHCFNQTYQYCITQWNSIDQHPIIRLIDVRTKEVLKTFEHLQQEPLQSIEQYQFVKPRLFSIVNRNNDTLYCALYKPDDEPGRSQAPYPTLVSVYGGPHLQR